MAEYNFRDIEEKWQTYWETNQTYKLSPTSERPKYYVLDMFPYPSGAGLHVGHPLGYIASDIVARFKRLKGYHVLHPMGFDAFGLPAEQYAIQTGQHPAVTTENNIKRYKEQLKRIGFSYDWSREIKTCDPSYYRWTQWIFMQLFNSWYNKKSNRAEPIQTLTQWFENQGNRDIEAACDDDTPRFSAQDWIRMPEGEKQQILLKYRLTYLAETTVNWCPALGTVLANDEVKDGFSERGGHPVEQKKMLQWIMRITAYADRLLDGLEKIDWPEAIKEMQRNWIGKSYGCRVRFEVIDHQLELEVFTTRVDTIFGVTFMTIAPEHEWVERLTTPEQKKEVEAYVKASRMRSERERLADVKHVTGAFSGSYVKHPFTGDKVPIWVADYVLAGYGTGIVMAVPSSDERDFAFATHFNLPIVQVQEGPGTRIDADDFDPKKGTMINSGFLNGMEVPEAIEAATRKVEAMGIGKEHVNFRMRDAVFSRQRYWGEPFPVYFEGNIPYLINESELPLTLPEVDEYLPTKTGEPPLGRAKNWHTGAGKPYELSTMPGWAGSSWYHFRYMDPENDNAFVDPDIQAYWGNVDFYMGGAEHATGHLLYSRFWTKFLHDRGYVSVDEPYQKLMNQGMIQGRSNFVYREKGTNRYISYNLRKDYDTTAIHVDVTLVENDVLDIEKFKEWSPDHKDAEFILENGQYICGWEIEKMSKSKFNVVNPDDVIDEFGADTFRLYEMFLGPIEQAKPWNTMGIDGSAKFLRKFWRLFHNDKGRWDVSEAQPTADELKVLHRTLKKIEHDITHHAFNTCVSEFMICVNDLTTLKCNKKTILAPLTIALSPFAPHICEEIWQLLGHQTSITAASFPAFDEKYLKEETFEYPVSVNGKMRTKIEFGTDMPKEDMEREVLQNEVIQKWTGGKPPRKVIIVPKKIINVVV